MFDREGVCSECGGDLYLLDDIYLCCETCGRKYNCMTGEVTQGTDDE